MFFCTKEVWCKVFRKSPIPYIRAFPVVLKMHSKKPSWTVRNFYWWSCAPDKFSGPPSQCTRPGLDQSSCHRIGRRYIIISRFSGRSCGSSNLALIGEAERLPNLNGTKHALARIQGLKDICTLATQNCKMPGRRRIDSDDDDEMEITGSKKRRLE